MKDAEIVELYWNRNEAAIAATSERYGNYCYSIAYHILQSPEDAQEWRCRYLRRSYEK